MHPSLYLTFLLFVLLAVNAYGIEQDNGMEKVSFVKSPTYPKVHRVNQTWSYQSANARGNITYSDPYFWLEATGKNKEIEQFVDDQTNVTETYIQGCHNKQVIEQSLLEASTFDKYKNVALVSSNNGGTPFYLYQVIRSGDHAPVWYTATVAEFQDAKKNNFQPLPGKPFLDEALLSADGVASILIWNTSPDGKIFSYLVIESGEVGTWFFRRFTSPLITAKTKPLGGEGRLKDILPVSSDQISWTPDCKGIFYPKTVSSDDGTNTDLGYKIVYHAWGTDNAEDITIFDSKNAGEYGDITYYFTSMSPNGKWLGIFGYHEDTYFNMVGYATQLTGQKISENMEWISISPSYDFSMFVGGIVDDDVIFQTNKDAPNNKVAKIHLDWSKARQVKNFTELQDRPPVIDVVAERENALIVQNGAFVTNNDKIVVITVENAQNQVHVYSLKDGKEISRLIPDEKVTYDVWVADQFSDTFIMLFYSWNSPRKIYEFKSKGSKVESSLVTDQHIKGTNPDDFAIEELYATSKDGTKVPYFVTYRKGTKKDGKAPAWVHVYGSYGIVDSLYYEPNYFDFLRSYNSFFVWALPRGGGDFGARWHEGGQGLKKQNTFDDTVAVLKDLIRLNITSPGQIIIQGKSAGGAAAAAVLNQVPDLVGVALLVKAPTDAFQWELRTTLGAANRIEFGDVTTPEGFDAVFAWSPLQNIQKKISYPAVLLTPGEDDERVVPSFSYKFVAQLQYDHPNNPKPLLMYVVKGQAHTRSTVGESVYQFCVIEESLGITRRKTT
ncbi:alpha/beta-hydrolase [Meira miltonrushii]|uniref:Prolyl endopeptidase n=1 Tax=Meira miltonrushii TaxID=1280837 RepID=A0A316VAI9_9BASI|nr:alpha/beta-hydrolase [Meira miltonrushii]PWN33213.1 alpha/beta-hydrolase [Meira miltonrushii]